MITITFIMRDGTRRDVAADPGKTLLQIAHQYQIYEIEGACGGAMACSTCHVIVDPDWQKKLPAATDDETDMLDLASGLTRTSRLACQITLTAAMNGLIVKLPQTTSNRL